MKVTDTSTRLRIGQRISELRRMRGLTQSDLASLTGYDRTNIAKIELGRYSVGVDVLSTIAKALDATLEIQPLN